MSALDLSTKRRPFYETIPDVIELVTDRGQMDCLSLLLHGTKIPENHDYIGGVWVQKCRNLGIGCDPWNVAACLLEQKREAEAEAKDLAARDEAMLREEVHNQMLFEVEDARMDCN